jgi:hypothetical protein
MPQVEYVQYCHYLMRSVDGRMVFEYGIEEVEAPAEEVSPLLHS